MRDESNLAELQRQVAGAKELIRQTKIEVAEVTASVEQICLIKEKLLVFLRHRNGKSPVRVRVGKRQRVSLQNGKGINPLRRPNYLN
ncbi:MAG TPA: hypothetical protein VGY56_14010 [Verrucomicrobiae bacterium]|nr:hypothetical protein [Verrucomicrobiae bacterium]